VSSADFFRFGWSGPRSSIVAVMAVSLRLLTEHADIIRSAEKARRCRLPRNLCASSVQ
jgi:hypothetical protein